MGGNLVTQSTAVFWRLPLSAEPAKTQPELRVCWVVLLMGGAGPGLHVKQDPVDQSLFLSVLHIASEPSQLAS